MQVSRRGFLGTLGTLVGGVLLEQAIPFGRVYSFPSKINIAERDLTPEELAAINRITQKYIVPALGDTVFSPSPVLYRLMPRPAKEIN